MDKALATRLNHNTHTMETTNLLLSIAWPVSLSTLYYPALHIVDLAIVGHSLGALSLTAATLTLLVVNLTLEPACFVLTNAITTLCAANDNVAHVQSYLRGAAVLSFLVALPIAGLLLATPAMLSPLLVSPELVEAVGAYATSYAVSIVPSLLLAALIGLLRAQRRVRQTALLCALTVLPNAGFALLLVPWRGLSGSAFASTVTRLVTLLLLAFQHGDALGLGAPTPPSLSHGGNSYSSESAAFAAATATPPPTVGQALTALGKHFGHAMLPATLRTGVARVLAILALVFGGPAEGTILALASLLLEAFHAICMGVQQAALMLSSRRLHEQRPDKVRHTMRVAGLLLTLLALACAIACALLHPLVGLLFTTTSGGEIATGLQALSAYIPPILLLRTASGLYGQFFAVTGRGAIGTVILAAAHWVVGLPAAALWAAWTTHNIGGGGSEGEDGAAPAATILFRAHAAAWLLTSAAFAGFYLFYPTAPPPPPPQLPLQMESSSPSSSLSGRNLTTPLLSESSRSISEPPPPQYTDLKKPCTTDSA